MIIPAMNRPLRRAMTAALLSVATAGCSGPAAAPDPMQLDGAMLTVDNRTSRDWTGVEIWLNRYFRVTTSSIPAGGRFQAPLDLFVSGYLQRFDARRMQINDLTLTAKLPDGTPLELKKQFQAGGLVGALGGKR
jgi:hypothetical protein